MLVVNNGALRSLEGLDSLTDVRGHLSVRNNSALTSLAGSNVSFVQLSVEVCRCCPRPLDAALARSLSRSVSLAAAFAALPARAKREAAHARRRQVSDNGALTSLHGLHHLTQLGPLCVPSSQPPYAFPLLHPSISQSQSVVRAAVLRGGMPTFAAATASPSEPLNWALSTSRRSTEQSRGVGGPSAAGRCK